MILQTDRKRHWSSWHKFSFHFEHIQHKRLFLLPLTVPTAMLASPVLYNLPEVAAPRLVVKVH